MKVSGIAMNVTTVSAATVVGPTHRARTYTTGTTIAVARNAKA